MKVKFMDQEGCFLAENADDTSYLYFPLTNEGGIMSSITPELAGDSKIDQNHFLLEPVSAENLHSNMTGRNIWCRIKRENEEALIWSAAGRSASQQALKYTKNKDRVEVFAGKLWQKVRRSSRELGITAEILSFCPATEEKAEIMKITLSNSSEAPFSLEMVAAIPIYGRSADNLRDHRHVTSLLHRILTEEDGVTVKPVLAFDERGHQKNETSYGIYGREDTGENPVGFYPVLEEFTGEGGSLLWPEAVAAGSATVYPAGSRIDGYEAMGGIRFREIKLEPGEEKAYYLVLSYNHEGMRYLSEKECERAYEEMGRWWSSASKVSCHSGDENFDRWMSWAGIQPVLRRIYGCSFLPHHDYGRGGRGWRDLWQDSLSLLLSDPVKVRPMLVSYFDGVRMDGSNATIIGAKPGEFKADRNAIVRVWMDHGLWPLITVNQYMEMTGDYEILLEEGTYFKDKVCCRGEDSDDQWDGKRNVQQTEAGETVKGTVLERILLQHLTMFYDVGNHNHMRLRGADWNDALDMAKENGESVAFTAAYSGNFKTLEKIFRYLRTEKEITEVEMNEEISLLLNCPVSLYDSKEEKQALLLRYCRLCRHTASGRKVKFFLKELEEDMRTKALWIQEHIRRTEWVGDGKGHHWFNGYYDNSGKQVEGLFENGLRMMLTGQVFSIMSGTATREQIEEICNAADEYLYAEELGGYRLNTDFGELKTDLGRMFGFAYGHKENGAVFSHMAVMYAYSLYSRGFIKEGYKVLQALYHQVMRTETSCIYPGIPEYFSDKGRGMYHYLTGAASWLVLTVFTEMFGIQGREGDLSLQPKLLGKQFDAEGKAGIRFVFAGQSLSVVYENKNHREMGEYSIEEVYLDGRAIPVKEKGRISRKMLENLETDKEHMIYVVLA